MRHADLQLSALMLGQAGELLTGGGDGGGLFDPFKSEEQLICEALGGTWPGGSGPCQGVDTIVLQKEKQKQATAKIGNGNGATDQTTMLLTVAAAALVAGGLWWIFKR